jgi:hypothetical protein
MSWTHTVLELYPKPLKSELPTEGEPADWIEEGKVLYCQGEDRTVIIFTPFPVILRWKLGYWAQNIYDWFFNNIYVHTPWGKRYMAKVRERLNSYETISTEELADMLGEEEMKELHDLVFGETEPDPPATPNNYMTQEDLIKSMEEKGLMFGDADEFMDQFPSEPE